jgi:hypothetical protein
MVIFEFKGAKIAVARRGKPRPPHVIEAGSARIENQHGSAPKDERDASTTRYAGSRYSSLDCGGRRIGANSAGRGSGAEDRTEPSRSVHSPEQA